MSFEPCLCGAPDCPRCFPDSYQSEAQWEWVNNYFPGKLCTTCDHAVTDEEDERRCNVLEGDASLDDCPALRADEEKISDDAAHSKWEGKHG